MSKRQDVLNRAASKIGSPDPDEFWKEVLATFKPGGQRGLAWCGAFALWALRPVTTRMWRLGLGFLSVPPALPQIENPEPADVAYFDRPFQHHALVEKIEGEILHTIDGNQGPPSTVKRKQRFLVPVDYVQRALNTHLAHWSTLLKDDNDMGPKTRAALSAFQVVSGLTPNGLADMPTIKALGLKPTAIFFSIARWVQ